LQIQANGDISFYEDTGTTPKLFWDASAESLGIGTSSPSAKIETTVGGNFSLVYNNHTGDGLFIQGNGTEGDNNYGGGISFSRIGGVGRVAGISSVQTDADSDINGLAFFVHSSSFGSVDIEEAMRIEGNGNVGIGTTSPSFPLHIVKDAAGQQSAVLKNASTNTAAASAWIASNGTNEIRLLRAGTSYSSYGSFTSSDGALYSDDSIVLMADNGSGIIKFATGGNSERMRINSDGSVKIADSSLDWPTSTVAQASGRMLLARDGNPNLVLANMASGTGASRGGNLLLGARGTNGTSNLAYAQITGLRASSTSGNVSSNLVFYTSDVSGTISEVARLKASGNLAFNSGYGSVADAYGCRAWVNYTSIGTVAIRASGGVSSLTDNEAGNTTVNFSFTMPDNDYAASGAAGVTISSPGFRIQTMFTTSVNVITYDTSTGNRYDENQVSVMVVR